MYTLASPKMLSPSVKFHNIANTHIIVRINLALLCYIGDSLPKTSFSVLVSFPCSFSNNHIHVQTPNIFSRASLHLVLPGSRPVETQGGVVGELADETVGGGAEGDGEDETNGKQLDGDLLERADALGDGVRCEALLILVASWAHGGSGQN